MSVNLKKCLAVLLFVIVLPGTMTQCSTSHPGANDQKKSSPVKVKNHHGIDVSHYSGTVDWTKVKAGGYLFAVVKATEGIDDQDPMFAAHWPAIKKTGLIRGAYHFYVTEDDPLEQAKFFIQTVALEKGDLAPVVDIEILGKDTSSGLASRLQTFLNALEKHYGIKPIIYTDPGFWNANLDDKFGSYQLWVADYKVPSPTLPIGWTTYHLWQWKGDAEVPGVEKTADLSKFNSKEKNFSQLLLK